MDSMKFSGSKETESRNDQSYDEKKRFFIQRLNLEFINFHTSRKRKEKYLDRTHLLTQGYDQGDEASF